MPSARAGHTPRAGTAACGVHGWLAALPQLCSCN